MLDPAAMYVLVVLAVCAAVLAHRRVTRGVFVLRVRDGAVLRARGAISETLLQDVRDVLARSGASGTVRAMDVGRATAAIELRGRFSPEVSQRLRNVLGNVPIARLRAGRR